MDEILTLSFWVSVLAGAIRLGTPLLFPTLGEIICERAGVLNLGQEGLMLVGALAGFMGAYYTGDAWIGFLAGLAAGGLLSLWHAFVSVTLRADQVISGIMLVLLGIGLTDFVGVYAQMAGQFVVWSNRWGFDPLHVPLLGDIPYLGKILFQQDFLVYLAILLVPLVWVLLFATRWGLAITAAGESPATADVLGINVAALRFTCVVVGGCFAGAGGAYVSLAMMKSWQSFMTAGRGWIAVALVIFAFWKPQRAIWGAYLFGGIDSLQMRLQAVGVAIPVDLISMMPYLATIGVLVFASRSRVLKRVGAPAALGLPYERGSG